MAGNQIAKTLFQKGVRVIQDGSNPDQGRRWLVESLRQDPENDAAWVWLAQVIEDPRKQADCIDHALAINPANREAQVAKKRIATGEFKTVTATKRATQPMPVTATQPMPTAAAKKSTQSMPAARTRTAELPVTRASGLGRLLMSADMNKWQLTQKIILSAFCIGFSVLFIYVSRTGVSKPGDNSPTYLFLIGLLPLIGLVALLYSIVMTFGIKVKVYENGIEQTHVGTTKTWNWEDFTAVRVAEEINTVRYHGIPVFRFHNYDCRLMQDNKVALHLNKNIQKYKEVGRLVAEKTTPILFARNYEAHRRGETVYYGKVAVSREGIKQGRSLVAWDDIASYKVDNGTLIIQKLGRGKMHIRVVDLPNAYVLMALIDQIKGSRY